MIKIDKLEKSKIVDIVTDDSPSFSGIITGQCKGNLWVDDVEKPSLALTYSFAVGGYCILGNPKKESVYEDLRNFLLKDLFPQMKKMDINNFEFSVELLEPQKRILDMFSDKVVGREEEFSFRKSDKTEIAMKIPVDYTIEKVSATFIEKLKHGEYQNIELLEERLLESWGSYENFLNKSVAFVGIHQKRIVAVIVGTARFNDIIPIDIETEEKHRNKGLASILTKCFVNDCIEHQLIPQWDCVDSNDSSKKIAQKAGFVFKKKKPYFWFEI